MSYAIQYGPEKKALPDTRRSGNLGLLGLGALILAAAALVLWPEGVQTLRIILFPWMQDATAVAFADMIGQIQNGTGVAEALVVFCREVIRNAGIPV